MKNLIILLLMIIMIFSCAMPEVIEEDEISKELPDVVLYDGVMNETTNLLFQKSTYGFPNSVIQVKFEFSDPVVFDGTYKIEINSGSNVYTIISHAPTFIVTHNVDMTSSLYFRVADSNWELDAEYDGSDVDCKITWVR